MAECQRCGAGTHARLCDTCELAVGSGRERTRHEDTYECQRCGGESSGPNTVCYLCRGGER